MKRDASVLASCIVAGFFLQLNNAKRDIERTTEDQLENNFGEEDRQYPGETGTRHSVGQDDTSFIYNHSVVAALLRGKGYEVYEAGNDMPVAILGDDIAMSAEKLLPEIFDVRERAISNVVHATWRNKKGKTTIHYFYDKEHNPNRQLFQQAANSWASHTCINFKRTEQTSCKEKVRHPSFCVGNFGGCWSFVGMSNWGGKKTGLGKSQKLSVSYRCELDACIHEFGHGLGFQHTQSRPDREKYLNVNWENFKITGGKNWERELSSTWYQGSICGKKQVIDIPTPYDFLSVMQYGSFDFVDNDIRPSFVTKEFEYQWMLDYHRSKGRGPTHYDYYLLNVAYHCPAIFAKSCKDNGKTAPGCVNYGYLTKNCKCKCPEGYSGTTCKDKDKKIGMYDRLEKAKCYMNWNYPGIIDVNNLNLDFVKRTYTNMNFNYMQFCTIIVDTRKDDMRPILFLDPSELLVRRRKLITLLHRSDFIDHILPQMYLFDCRQFFKLFWTSNVTSPQRRTECFSSIFNLGKTVRANKMLSLRGKTRKLSIYLDVIYKWSEPAIEFLEAAFKLKIQVKFDEIPNKALKRDDNYTGGLWSGSTGLPPTIPIDLRFETTTPNIFGIALPAVFRDSPNPRLTFIGWVILIMGILACTFFAGAFVSERTNMRALLMFADRTAALNDGGANVLAAGWVRLRGVDVEDERRKAEEGKENWFLRIFGIEASSSESEDEDEIAADRHEVMQQKARGNFPTTSKHIQNKMAANPQGSLKRKRESSSSSSSSGDDSDDKNKANRSLFGRSPNSSKQKPKRMSIFHKAEAPERKKQKFWQHKSEAAPDAEGGKHGIWGRPHSEDPEQPGPSRRMSIWAPNRQQPNEQDDHARTKRAIFGHVTLPPIRRTGPK